MGSLRLLWVFSFCAALVHAENSLAQQGAAASGIPGAGTFVPPSAQNNPRVNQPPASPPSAPTSVTVPTPDTIPAPSSINTGTSYGQYRNQQNEIKLAKMLLDRYQSSVVRVTARDLAGNELARAMGVGVGRNAQYIATPLSIVLGNSQQWADSIEITHAAGNKYKAKVALIDEEKNLVLLAPEANPAPIPFAREIDERPQTSIYAISFENNPQGQITPEIKEAKLAATNQETGLLSVTNNEIQDSYAGTGLLNAQGELVGMLLPGAQGVLSSTLQKLVLKAQKTKPFEPSLIGVILGRGVLVDPKLPGAYRSIPAALEAIRKGEAPKADITRYTPASGSAVAPRGSDKVIVRVMPGKYKEEKTISLPANISIAGSGPHQTVVYGSARDKPVFLVQNAENVSLSNLRIVPAALQAMKAPAVIVSKSQGITLTGNIFEAKGGVALWLHESRNVVVRGNVFARGQQRGLSCDRSDLKLEFNAFIGDWPVAVSADRNCTAHIFRNLFLENKSSISVSSLAGRLRIERNSFVRNDAGVRFTASNSKFTLDDNLFFENAFGVYGAGNLDVKGIGRNAVWKSKFQARGRTINGLDFVRTEPAFVAPGYYDFRIAPGKGQLGEAAKTPGADLGAFQRSDFMGESTSQLAHALQTATNESELLAAWGLTP
jgi:hypothetical protein